MSLFNGFEQKLKQVEQDAPSSRRGFLSGAVKGTLYLAGLDALVGCAFGRVSVPRDNDFYELKISGDELFTKQVKKALDLIADKDPGMYEGLVEHIQEIRQNSYSGMDALRKIYNISDLTAFGVANVGKYKGWDVNNRSVYWLASTIVHDAKHSELFWEFKTKYPNASIHSDIYSGKEAELECLKAQRIFLKKAGAPTDLERNVASFSGEYCEPGDKRCVADFKNTGWKW